METWVNMSYLMAVRKSREAIVLTGRERER
jgi:hypothetical protein